MAEDTRPLPLIFDPTNEDGTWPLIERRHYDRRQNPVRMATDVADAENLKADISEIKSEIRLISRTLQQIAVQEEKIRAIQKIQEDAQETVRDIYGRINSLQSEHNSCSVGKIAKDMEWVKWIIMVLTVSIVGMLFSQFSQLMKGNGDVPKQRALHSDSIYLDLRNNLPPALRVCIPEGPGRDG